jgi:hypothetical protein
VFASVLRGQWDHEQNELNTRTAARQQPLPSSLSPLHIAHCIGEPSRTAPCYAHLDASDLEQLRDQGGRKPKIWAVFMFNVLNSKLRLRLSNLNQPTTNKRRAAAPRFFVRGLITYHLRPRDQGPGRRPRPRVAEARKPKQPLPHPPPSHYPIAMHRHPPCPYPLSPMALLPLRALAFTFVAPTPLQPLPAAPKPQLCK